MPAPVRELVPGVRALTIGNAELEVTLLVDKGADIYSIVHRRSGVDVLFKSPWGLRAAGPWGRAVTSMERWLECYGGGWQVLLPNGGDECTEGGATWGFHGEAALVPWKLLDYGPSAAMLEAELFFVPLHLSREIWLEGPVLRLREVVANTSPHPVEFMWSHHPAFGAPFLDRSCVLRAGCRTVVADDRGPGTLLEAGTRHNWPRVSPVSGATVDLTEVPGPDQPREIFAYLLDFDAGYFAITNPTLRLGFGLRWPLEVFDKAWLWQQVHAGPGWPWFGRAYVVAVEPASTVPGQGMANARTKGASGVRLDGLASREVVLEAVLFESASPVSGIAEGGVVSFEVP